MALVTRKPLALSADTEEELYSQITGALLSVNSKLSMFKACVPIELKATAHSLFELSEEKSLLSTCVSSFQSKVKKHLNVDHPHIFLLWIPRILKSTDATAEIRCEYLATGDVKSVGKFSLNEAFIFSFGWERSIRLKDVLNGKGLCLHVQTVAPSCPPKAPLGRLVPMWDSAATAKMRYTESVGTSLTIADEMRVKTVLSDSVTRGLLSSYMAQEYTCKEDQKKFLAASRVQLSDDLPDQLDFSHKVLPSAPSLSDVPAGANSAPALAGKVSSGDGVIEDLTTSSKSIPQNTP